MKRIVVLYHKPGCCLCDTLEQKLQQLAPVLDFVIEKRDILTDPDWFADFQYTIPVLEVDGRTLGGISHRMPLVDLMGSLQQALM